MLRGLISFLIFRYVGSPVDNLLAQEATVQQRADLEEALGLNDPVYVQYFGFVWKALHFDFGNSYRGARYSSYRGNSYAADPYRYY